MRDFDTCSYPWSAERSFRECTCTCDTGLLVLFICYPSLVLVQSRKTCPCLTERLLMGRKENQIKQTKNNWLILYSEVRLLNVNALFLNRNLVKFILF